MSAMSPAVFWIFVGWDFFAATSFVDFWTASFFLKGGNLFQIQCVVWWWSQVEVKICSTVILNEFMSELFSPIILYIICWGISTIPYRTIASLYIFHLNNHTKVRGNSYNSNGARARKKMRMPPPAPNQPFAPGKWTKTPWTFSSDLHNKSIYAVYTLLFGIFWYSSLLFSKNNPFSARTKGRCQGTKAMLSFNDRLLGISRGAFSAWSSSRSSEDSIVAASQGSVGPTVGRKVVGLFV